jgi:hypothetical protein
MRLIAPPGKHGEAYNTSAPELFKWPAGLALGSRLASSGIMMRMPTAPGVYLQSAMTSPTARSSGSTGLTIAKRPGWARCTSTA